jgi:hypothetical protein
VSGITIVVSGFSRANPPIYLALDFVTGTQAGLAHDYRGFVGGFHPPNNMQEPGWSQPQPGGAYLPEQAARTPQSGAFRDQFVGGFQPMNNVYEPEHLQTRPRRNYRSEQAVDVDRSGVSSSVPHEGLSRLTEWVDPSGRHASASRCPAANF